MTHLVLAEAANTVIVLVIAVFDKRQEIGWVYRSGERGGL